MIRIGKNPMKHLIIFPYRDKYNQDKQCVIIRTV